MTMEIEMDLPDAVLDDLGLTDNEETRTFFDVCCESFLLIKHKHKCDDSKCTDDWIFFVSLLLQMGFVDINDTEDFYSKLRNPLSRDRWCFRHDENGRICCIRLEPKTANQKIPGIIRRLDGTKSLFLSGKNVSALHLEGVSPLPRLEELNMVWIKGTLKRFVEQIPIESPPVHRFKSLQKLYFLPNEDWDDEHLQTDELQTFLDSFISIDTVRFPDNSIETIGPPTTPPIDKKWKYSLIKNTVGRRMLEKLDVDSTTKLPLPLWPLILERVQRVTDETSRATGIYYLLREGQIFSEPRSFESLEEKKDSTFDEEEEDDYEDEENDTFEADGGAKTFVALSSPTHRTEAFRRASVNIYGGDGFEVAEEDLFEKVYDGEERISDEDYDPWLFQEFDRTGKRRDFTILGTSHDDIDCHPHVLSPVQMDLFQPHLPDAKKGESFWLKYSLVRDGASTISFLKQVRASPYTLLAMETVDGEVFGGFFCSAWTIQPNYFGTGESFLWRMKDARKLEGSLVEQNDRESDLEIFPSEIYYANRYFQMCLQDKIVSGGGATSLAQDFGLERGGEYQPHQIGFGLQLGSGGSLLEGSSSASLTFRNPPLSRIHSDGSTFELVNLEAWGFTPCQTEEEARILEYKNMFFKRNASGSLSNSGRHGSGLSL